MGFSGAGTPAILCAGYERMGKSVEVSLAASDNRHLAGSIRFGDPRLWSVEKEDELFTEVQVPGLARPVGLKGYPAVPLVHRLIAVPRGAAAAIQATARAGRTLALNLYPIQGQPVDDFPPPETFDDPPFEKDEAVYGNDAFYPENVCGVALLGQMRDVIVARVFPVNDGDGPGPDTAAEIDAFIEERYKSSQVRPSYVLLLGDAEFVPTFYVPSQALAQYGYDTIGSDYPYAVVQDPHDPFDALLPDIAVGRISVDTLAEAYTVVNKIIRYESDPPQELSFYSRAALAAQFQCCRDDVEEDGTTQRTFVEVSEFARGVLVEHGYQVDRIYTETTSSGYFIKQRNLLMSRDGIEWTPGSAGTPRRWQGIAYGAGRFVAVGIEKSFTSPDGVDWTSHAVADLRGIQDVGYWKDMFIAVSWNGAIWTSTDGVNWLKRPSPTTLTLDRIAFRQDLTVVVGTGGVILTSSNGIDWNLQTSGADRALLGVAARDDLIVAVGVGGITVLSTDGTNWSVPSPTNRNLRSITVLEDGTFLAAGDAGAILTTRDGTNWDLQNSLSLKRFNTAFRIARGTGIYVGMGGRDAAPRRYFDGAPISEDIGPDSGFLWGGDTDDIVSAFNSGRFLVMHRDHGWIEGWVHPEFTRDDVVDRLENGDLLPVVFSVNCASGSFDHDETAAPGFGEELLRKAGGGAVGVLGDTRPSPSWPNTYLAKGFFDAIWPGAIGDFGGNESRRRLGDILNHGKLYMLSRLGALVDLFGTEEACGEVLDEYYLWHAFGDPTLEIWTSRPQMLPNIGEMEAFEDHITVFYPVDGAVITAYQDSEGGMVPIGRGKVAGGQAVIATSVFPDETAVNPVAWVVKLNSTGDIQWQRSYGGEHLDVARSIDAATDGYVLAGTTESFRSDDGQVWVFRLNGDGTMGCMP